MSDRRQRVHELVLALLARQGDLELLDGEGAGGRGEPAGGGDAAGWLERNRRRVRRYQALVRSAVTLDALIDQEVGGPSLSAAAAAGAPPPPVPPGDGSGGEPPGAGGL